MAVFKTIAKDGQARAGILSTPHGKVQTPVYMPVGTQGTVKSLTPDDLKTLGAEIILGNTYHLNLRPTSELIKKMGGLHKFMGWDGPILTDSGGFQAFSLGAMIEHGIKKVSQPLNHKSGILNQEEPKVRKSGKVYDTKNKTIHRRVTVEVKPEAVKALSKITEEGVEFKSHLDGGKHLLTPERSIEIQINLGADIILVLDELISPLHSESYVAQSLERTHRWELRSQKYYKTIVKKNREKKGSLFGILQGVDDRRIREQEAKWIAKQDFDGVSIGGSFGTSPLWSESLTKNPEFAEVEWASTRSIEQTMSWVTPLLPDSWPRHALGIGEVVDFFLCIEKGVDMFDCVAPTRRARNGSLYISPENGGKFKNKFVLNIGNSEFMYDSKPIEPGCGCYTCQNFSKSYLRHLFIARELLYFRLASIHNLYFMVNLVKKIRQSIIDKQFKKLKKQWLG
jgi:queuine tRNA-ribosyltransferase/7-cyano-7-deazaguanine tRNA-ribosyltransferase